MKFEELDEATQDVILEDYGLEGWPPHAAREEAKKYEYDKDGLVIRAIA